MLIKLSSRTGARARDPPGLRAHAWQQKEYLFPLETAHCRLPSHWLNPVLLGHHRSRSIEPARLVTAVALRASQIQLHLKFIEGEPSCDREARPRSLGREAGKRRAIPTPITASVAPSALLPYGAPAHPRLPLPSVRRIPPLVATSESNRYPDEAPLLSATSNPGLASDPAGTTPTGREPMLTATSFPALPRPLPGPPRTPGLAPDGLPLDAGGPFSPEDALNEQIEDLERWVRANERGERWESIRFWVLRVPAFICALVATAGATYGDVRVVVGVAGAVALLVVIDSAWVVAMAHNPLVRALRDLRRLQNTAKLRWDRVRLAYPDPTSANRIARALTLLDAIQAKRESIGRYLNGYVASPGIGERPF